MGLLLKAAFRHTEDITNYDEMLKFTNYMELIDTVSDMVSFVQIAVLSNTGPFLL